MTFYNDDRLALQASARTFVEREISPHLQEWEDAGEIPRSLHQVAAKAGLLGLGFPEEAGGDGGDLADATAMQEAFFAAGASSGLMAGLFTHGIALPHMVDAGRLRGDGDIDEVAVGGEEQQNAGADRQPDRGSAPRQGAGGGGVHVAAHGLRSARSGSCPRRSTR